MQNLDHDASEINPVLFREYLEAEDDEKGMIEVNRVSPRSFLSSSTGLELTLLLRTRALQAQLKYLKVYSHLLIKRRWREWRLDLIVKLKATHEADLADLQEVRCSLSLALHMIRSFLS